MVQIVELRALIEMRFPHICINQDDLTQFLNIPQEKDKFYPMNKYRRELYDKKGFFHKGETAVWAVDDSAFYKDSHRILPNHIRMADKEIPTLPGSADRIRRMMKMKAFW
jgi:hypothetical protein